MDDELLLPATVMLVSYTLLLMPGVNSMIPVRSVRNLVRRHTFISACVCTAFYHEIAIRYKNK